MLSVSGNGYSDQSMIRFDAGANQSFNSGLDAFKFTVFDMEVPQLYTVGSDYSNLAVNVINYPENDVTTTVPLNFESDFDGTYTINVDELTMGNHYTVYLKDLVTEEVIDLKQVPTYQFDWLASDDADRFEILFNSFVNVEDLNNSTGENINIYSHGQKLFVSLENTSGASNLEVYNVTGRKLFGKIIPGDGSYEYRLEYPTGGYFVKIVTEQNVVSKKIIIIK